MMHRLTLMGGPHDGLRVPAAVLQEVLAAVIEGARLAARFRFEGESVRKGPRPGWLDAATNFDVTGLESGSTVVGLEAPLLGQAAPMLFEEADQQSFFARPGRDLADQTALDLFGAVLSSVVDGDADAIEADRPLLDGCLRFAKLLGDTYNGISLEGLHGRTSPLVLTPDHVPRIELLRDETPAPEAVRVTGALDTISASRSDVVLCMTDGSKVPARIEDHNVEGLRRLFGSRVVVSGLAHFRPSGRLLHIEVEQIAEAAEGDQLFERVPVARRTRPVVLPPTLNESAGVASFFGTWPGDEDDQELLDAVRTAG